VIEGWDRARLIRRVVVLGVAVVKMNAAWIGPWQNKSGRRSDGQVDPPPQFASGASRGRRKWESRAFETTLSPFERVTR
jgi:hypothetical protein